VLVALAALILGAPGPHGLADAPDRPRVRRRELAPRRDDAPGIRSQAAHLHEAHPLRRLAQLAPQQRRLVRVNRNHDRFAGLEPAADEATDALRVLAVVLVEEGLVVEPDGIRLEEMVAAGRRVARPAPIG